MSTDIDNAASAMTAAPKHGLWHRLYHGETTYDFVGKRKIGYAVSGVLLVLTLVGLFARGLNLGIDFEGGESFQVPSKNLTVAQAEDVIDAQGISLRDAKVQQLQGDTPTIKVTTPTLDEGTKEKLATALADKAGVDINEIGQDSVSSTWGSEVTKKAIIALVVFFILLAVYISWRFEWRMAIAAIVAVLHDVAISVGVYALFGLPVSPATVIAFLTILGFSLYDTIVVFDKVQENTQRFGSRASYADIVNLSMNQVLMRSINTSIAAVLPVLSILIVGSIALGVVALQDFSLALLIGLIAGSYSSIFIATPVLAWLKEKEPKYAAIKDRKSTAAELARMRAGESPGAGGRTKHRTAAEQAVAASAAVGPIVTDPTAILTHPPRPRKKRR